MYAEVTLNENRDIVSGADINVYYLRGSEPTARTTVPAAIGGYKGPDIDQRVSNALKAIGLETTPDAPMITRTGDAWVLRMSVKTSDDTFLMLQDERSAASTAGKDLDEAEQVLIAIGEALMAGDVETAIKELNTHAEARGLLPEIPIPFNPGTGPMLGYAAGHCGHRVALDEWRAGFRNCERCYFPAGDEAAEIAECA